MKTKKEKNLLKNDLKNGNFEKSFNKEPNHQFYYGLLKYLANR